jgi:hypothetical protein
MKLFGEEGKEASFRVLPGTHPPICPVQVAIYTQAQLLGVRNRSASRTRYLATVLNQQQTPPVLKHSRTYAVFNSLLGI